MPLFYPDDLQHNNPNKALVDITQLRGTSYPLDNISSTGSIPSDKRKIGIIIFASSSQEFYGFYGQTTGSSDWDNPSNWSGLGSNVDTSSFVTTSSFNSFTGSYNTGSFTGSFIGDGSQLTGIVSSKWTGSNPISRESDVEITGSFRSSGSQVYLTTNDFRVTTGDNTSNLITGDNINGITIQDTGSFTSADFNNRQLIKSDGGTIAFDWENGILTSSLYGTSSWAENSLTASYVSASNIDGTVTSASYALSASYAPFTQFPYTGSAQITGSLGITGSFDVGSIFNVNSNTGIDITAGRTIVPSGNRTINLGSGTRHWQSIYTQFIRLADSSGDDQIKISAPTLATSPDPAWDFVLPAGSGSEGQVLSISSSIAGVVSTVWTSSVISSSYALSSSNALSSSYAESASYALSSSYSQNAGTASIIYVSESNNFSLNEIEVADFDANVAVTFNSGRLKFIFGTPTSQSITSFSFNSSFNTDRFNQVFDVYTASAIWSNGAYTLVSASIFEGSTLLATTGTGTSLIYGANTTGSHTYTLEVTSSNPLDNSIVVKTSTLLGNLSKINPGNPTITSTSTVQLGASLNQIEQGATGSISFTSASGASNGWVLNFTSTNLSSPVFVTGSATGSASITINATSSYSSSGVAGSDNNPALITTTTTSSIFSKIRSVRAGASAQASFTQAELENLATWDNVSLGGNIGPIYKGTTIPSGATVSFTYAGDKYLYIVYDASRPNLSAISVGALNVIGNFTLTTVGQYKVYRTNVLNAGGTGTLQTYILT